MKNHIIVDGKLIQVNKRFSQLKQSQKEIISGWLYEAYVQSASEGKPNDEKILVHVMECIEKKKIWIPYEELEQYYRTRKSAYQKRLAKGGQVPTCSVNK